MEYFNLTHPQRGIWEIEMVAKETPIGCIGGTIFFHEEVDVKVLEKAINKLIEVNDSIRIHIKMMDFNPVQYVSSYSFRNFKMVDFYGESKEEQEKWVNKNMRTPFNLYEEDLFEVVIIRAFDGEIGFYLKIHHIIADAWTMALIGSQVMEYYKVLMEGGELSSKFKPSYIEYVISENNYLTSSKYEKDKEYWDEKFQYKPTFSSMKTRDKAFYSSLANRKTFIINEENLDKIKKFCRENLLSPGVLFEAAIGIYVERFFDIKDVTLGVPVLNRRDKREKATSGMFVSTVPMRIEIDKNNTFLELCKIIGKEHREVFRHQRYPYSVLLSEIRKKHKIRHNLYDISVSYQNAKIVKCDEGDNFKTKWYFNGHLLESICLHIDDRDYLGVLVLNFDYLVELFTEEEIGDLYNTLMLFINQGIENISLKLYEMELVNDKERYNLLYGFNNTLVDYPIHKCIHEIFEEQVEKTPDNIALEYEGKFLTYKELNNRSNNLALILRSKGVGPNVIVGLLLERSFETIIGILGVLKAGGAYLPIDPDYPEERIKYMIEDSGTKMVLSSSMFKGKLLNVQCICMDSLNECEEEVPNLDISCDSKNLVYLIYTSGSTGKPKGAMITHSGVVNYILWTKKVYCDNKAVNFPLFTPYSFDLTVTSIFTPIISGAAIIIYRNENIKRILDKIIEEDKVGVMKLTPTHLNLLKNVDGKEKHRVNKLIVGGEDLKTEVAKKVYKEFKGNIEIYNEYGPTETVVGCMIYKYDYCRDNKESVPIGVPSDNVMIYILDKYMKPVPIGKKGELYVSGAGVGAGYINNAKITKERFIENHFVLGERMYRTGDLGKWAKSGDIEYLGRIDNQIKIRGFRVEAGEIEKKIEGYEGISQAIVNVYRDKSGNKHLCAYYVSKEDIETQKLKSFLKETLAEYMVPTYFVRVEDFSITPNGKVDRNNLPEPEINNIRTKDFVAPRNDLEKKIAEIFYDLFDTKNIGIDDNLFDDLGGDSLIAIQLQILAEKQGIKVEIEEIYKYPTIRQLAYGLNEGKSEVNEYDDLDYLDISNRFREFNNKKEMKNVLLTGASGFLGTHILFKLLSDYKDVKVTCLVRDEKRFYSSLEYYFDKAFIVNMKRRISCVKGDIREDNLGLELDIYNKERNEIDTVIHTAANIKHFGVFEDFYKTNVKGTEEVIKFCLKSGARMYHISTMSVSGQGIIKQSQKMPEFSENNLYIGQAYKDNVYIQTKYLAEKAVIDSMEKGLDVCILRVGNLMWREGDGRFQKNPKDNGFINRTLAIHKLGVTCEELQNSIIDLTPVDKCAEAVIKIAKFTESCGVFHLINHNEISYIKLFDMLNKKLNTISTSDFYNIVNDNKEEDKVGVLYLYLNGIKENINTLSVNIKSNFTKEFLNGVGFEWNCVDEEYIKGVGVF